MAITATIATHQKTTMYDLHCHMLPSIDDGAQTMEQAIELAKAAIDNGITHSIVTPHIHPGRYANTYQNIHDSFMEFQQTLKQHELDLKLGFAAEVRLSIEIMSMVEQHQIPFYGQLNGEKIMLLECPHSHIPAGTDKLIYWLLKQNIRPLIAHPERNKDILRKPEKLDLFIQTGCLLQITADALTGGFGEIAKKRADYMVSEGYATVLASDAHNIKHRPPRLQPGLDAAIALIGEQAANKLVIDNPKAICQSQFTHE